jgi:hypothetical protein
MSRNGIALVVVVAGMACAAAHTQPAHATLAETVERYCRSYEQGDADSILRLYQENALSPEIAASLAQRIRAVSNVVKGVLHCEVITLSEMGGIGFARLRITRGEGTDEEKKLSFKVDGNKWVIIENQAASWNPDPVLLNELSVTLEKARLCTKPTAEEQEDLMGRSVALFLDVNSGDETRVLAQFSGLLPVYYTSGWDADYELKQVYRDHWKRFLTVNTTLGTRRIPLLNSAESSWVCQVYWEEPPNLPTPMGQGPIGQFRVFVPYLRIAVDPGMHRDSGELRLGRQVDPGGVCITWIRTSNGFEVLDLQPCNGLKEGSVWF